MRYIALGGLILGSCLLLAGLTTAVWAEDGTLPPNFCNVVLQTEVLPGGSWDYFCAGPCPSSLPCEADEEPTQDGETIQCFCDGVGGFPPLGTCRGKITVDFGQSLVSLTCDSTQCQVNCVILNDPVFRAGYDSRWCQCPGS